MVFKEKYLEQKRKREELEKEFAKQVERVSDLKAKEKVKNLETTLQASEDIEKTLRGTITKLRNDVERLGFEVKDLRRFKQKGEDTDNLREAFLKFLRLDEVPKAPGLEPGPSEVNVKAEQPSITVETLREPLGLSQKDLLGRIAIVYAEELLPDKAFSLNQLNMIMEQRFGRKEAYPNFGKPLTQFVAWGYFEKVKAGNRWDYRVKMSPGTAREKGLLKVKEE